LVNRFLMLVGVAVVAAAMYVAGSSASQVSKGVSLAKFNALNKKVSVLTKRVKSDEGVINTVGFAYVHCSLPSAIDISQRSGYQFGSSTTTALDLGTAGTSPFVVTPFNTSDSACTSLIGAAPARHRAAARIAQAFGLTR
jgi:hypothetical protein